MRVLVISLLVAAAGWLIVPAVIRRHRQASVTASVADFQQHIRLLATRLAPPSHRPSQASHPSVPRRVVVARCLVGATVLEVVPAAVAGGWLWVAPLVTATLYVAYLTLLRRTRRHSELRAKVHHLPLRPTAQPPAALVRAQ